MISCSRAGNFVVGVRGLALSFPPPCICLYSADLDQNQITIYPGTCGANFLPLAGVERADILGARVFAMRVWLKLIAWRLNLSPSDVRRLSKNNFLSAVRKHQGTGYLGQSHRRYRITEERRKSLKPRGLNDGTSTRSAFQVSRTPILGAENYVTKKFSFSGQKATFVGILALPGANSFRRHQGGPSRAAGRQIASQPESRSASTLALRFETAP